MNAQTFSNLIRNNCEAATKAIAAKELSFEVVIGILESHKQALFDWRIVNMQQMIQPANTIPKKPPQV